MKTCRVCGATGDWDWTDDVTKRMDHYYRRDPNPNSVSFWMYEGEFVCHIEELCRVCNWKYNKFYKRVTYRSSSHVERDERILVQFVAHRLHILARRHASGLSITVCQALTPTHQRCSHWWSKEMGRHKLCKTHALAFRRGNLAAFAHEDAAWSEQVLEFFRMNNDGNK